MKLFEKALILIAFVLLLASSLIAAVPSSSTDELTCEQAWGFFDDCGFYLEDEEGNPIDIEDIIVWCEYGEEFYGTTGYQCIVDNIGNCDDMADCIIDALNSYIDDDTIDDDDDDDTFDDDTSEIDCDEAWTAFDDCGWYLEDAEGIPIDVEYLIDWCEDGELFYGTNGYLCIVANFDDCDDMAECIENILTGDDDDDDDFDDDDDDDFFDDDDDNDDNDDEPEGDDDDDDDTPGSDDDDDDNGCA